MTRPHAPTDGCANVHCHSHGVDEPGRTLPSVASAGTGFPTVADLLADHAALVERLNAHPIADPRTPDAPPVLMEAATDPDQIWACPHCAHDL